MDCFREKILSFDDRVPRYTSYPTAPHFQKLNDPQTYLTALSSLPEETKLSLYLHVPFCQKLCWYCGCHTKITQRYAPVEDYAHLMMREIEILADSMGGRRSVSNIHFGGGSPGMLRAVDFEQIMEKLRTNFDVLPDADIAIEIDPRGVTEGRAAAYARNGVNRVSLGVQDFDETVLKSVNRQQPFHLSYEAIKLFREYGIHDINVDLMYGLPHQSVESLKRTLEKLLILEPDRISFFGYAHVPWMKKHMRLIDEGALPEKDLRYDMFRAGESRLIEAGYVPIGIDHFAKPGDSLIKAYQDRTLTRNFQGYTDDHSTALIGIGASSIGKTQYMYFQNHAEMPQYKKSILASQLPINKACPITSEDRLRADIIEQLMCYMHVDLKEICRKYDVHPSHFDTELERLQSYEKVGFLRISEDFEIEIHMEARLMARMICATFDEHLNRRAAEEPRHAQAI